MLMLCVQCYVTPFSFVMGGTGVNLSWPHSKLLPVFMGIQMHVIIANEKDLIWLKIMYYTWGI